MLGIWSPTHGDTSSTFCGTVRASGVTTVYRNTSPILTWSMLTKKKEKNLMFSWLFGWRQNFLQKMKLFFKIVREMGGGYKKRRGRPSAYLFFSSIFFFFNTIPETPLGLRSRFARNNYIFETQNFEKKQNFNILWKFGHFFETLKFEQKRSKNDQKKFL